MRTIKPGLLSIVMDKKERNHMYYEKAKEKGVCWNCGNKKDRDGYYCSECLRKRRENEKEARKFYLSIGICPICRKNRILGDEKSCFECRAKEAERGARNRKIATNDTKIRINDYKKRVYSKRLEDGMCPGCGKKPDNKNFKLCSMCRAKKRDSKRIRVGNHPREERYKRGICYFCDNPVEKGYKVCEKHHQMNIEKSRGQKAREARERLIKEKILY